MTGKLYQTSSILTAIQQWHAQLVDKTTKNTHLKKTYMGHQNLRLMDSKIVRKPRNLLSKIKGKRAMHKTWEDIDLSICSLQNNHNQTHQNLS